eukprot:7934293-Ditylum_brightwellii.AAC.1
MNMMINRDTEPRENDGEGFVSDLDDKTKKAAFSILSEVTGHGYERMQKTIESVSDIRLPYKHCMDKEWPPIDAISITPLDSSYDESAGFHTLGINCTTEEGSDFALSSNMPNDWTLDENAAVLVTSQRKKVTM